MADIMVRCMRLSRPPCRSTPAVVTGQPHQTPTARFPVVHAVLRAAPPASPQDMHNDIQDVLGQNYGVPDDVDEDELLGELDALEADMAFEAEETAAQGAVPSYLQARTAPRRPPSAGPRFVDCLASCWPGDRPQGTGAHCGAQPALVSRGWKCCCLYVQEPELPEAPHEQQPLAEGELSLPAVPQRS
jgi:Snf7